jgi:hypothetical protein
MAGHDAANVSASKTVPIIPLNLRRVSLIIDSSFSKVMKKSTVRGVQAFVRADEEPVSALPGKPTSALRLPSVYKK